MTRTKCLIIDQVNVHNLRGLRAKFDAGFIVSLPETYTVHHLPILLPGDFEKKNVFA